MPYKDLPTMLVFEIHAMKKYLGNLKKEKVCVYNILLYKR